MKAIISRRILIIALVLALAIFLLIVASMASQAGTKPPALEGGGRRVALSQYIEGGKNIRDKRMANCKQNTLDQIR